MQLSARARALIATACLVGAQTVLPVSVDALSGGPSVELGWEQQRDARFNRTRYAGPGGAIGGYLMAEHDGWQQEGWLHLGAAYLDNRLDFGLLRMRYGFRYGVRVPVAALPHGPLQLVASLGGGSRFGLYLPEDPEHIHWSTFYGLSLGARTTRGAWSLQFELPVAGLASRPPLRTVRNNDKPGVGDILGRVHDDLGGCTVNRCLGLRTELRWTRPWGMGSVLTGLTLDYLHLSFPAPAHLLDVRLTLAYLFGT